MLAAKRPQIVFVQRLYANRYPVDAGSPIAAEIVRLDAGGVGLQRDLDVISHRPALCDVIDHAGH
jgi:hypothetical protein